MKNFLIFSQAIQPQTYFRSQQGLPDYTVMLQMPVPVFLNRIGVLGHHLFVAGVERDVYFKEWLPV